MKFQPESKAMRLARLLGMEGVAWSLRRLHCPVSAGALVLEVGSGGNPYPRANVLLDAYEDTIERFHAPLVVDRPMVYGVAERMPFRNAAFDFVIASHVLEHSRDPAGFLSELMRVARAGYIETPDAFCERIIPFRFHRLEVTERDGKIVIWRKPEWRPHAELVELFEQKLKDEQFVRFMERHPAPFYVRYYWEDSIACEIVNPGVDISWPLPKEGGGHGGPTRPVRQALTRMLRWAFSQRQRNQKIDLLQVLRCVSCESEKLESSKGELHCSNCGKGYQIKEGVPVMLPETE